MATLALRCPWVSFQLASQTKSLTACGTPFSQLWARASSGIVIENLSQEAAAAAHSTCIARQKAFAKGGRAVADDSSSSEDIQAVEDVLLPAQVTEAAVNAEAEWLRAALQQWLDNEYCPEPANIEIAKRCARVYRYCLFEDQRDAGEVLLAMVRDLETMSFKESFHSAFTSANAAVALLIKRMGERESSSDA
eukprot:jgi/Chlat1/9115/Chrsp97S09278